MKPSLPLSVLLLLSTALGSSVAMAQGSPATTPSASPAASSPASTPDPTTAAGEAEEDVSISAPGALPEDDDEAIVITGRRIPNVIRTAPEVVSVLSAADIARTGEGDIAGALQRVTGLSVVGGRFVYVRGLGERYSLALLNGLPLPSPEPLRRVVPLDLFPTSVLASTVVQKSYSVNYPGEFGGGVINLTTRAVPKESFLTFGGSIGANTVTTSELGYTYQGGDLDFLGFDDDTREVPRLLQQANDSGNLLVAGENFTVDEIKSITASLVNAPTNLIQRNRNIPANFALDVSGGTAFDVGDTRIGIVATAGWKNGWQTKGGLQQLSAGARPGPDGQNILVPDQDFRFLSTENRAVVNGLVGIGAEFGDHTVRFTNFYVRDTIKEARIQAGVDQINVGEDLVNRNFTSWFERQLIVTQGVGEFKFDNLKVELRGTYANSKRRSPYERVNSYRFSPLAGDFFNDLRTNGTFSTIAFSRLSENVYGAGADVGYRFEQLPFPVAVSAGYSYTDNQRVSTRRDYRYLPQGALPFDVAQERPDFLLSDFNVFTYDILLTETSASAGAAKYEAGLTVHAGYGQIDIEPVDGVKLTLGVRYEDGKQFVTPVDLFGLGGSAIIPTRIENDYFLPAGTLTWTFADDMQARLSASRTVARPQFRELAPQFYLDTDSDRTSFGNQFLVDSELFNAEARFEWFFGRDERFTAGGFYKKLDRPIETIAFQQGGTFFTTFANAPEAELYGVELEAQKYVPLDEIVGGDFFATRRLFLSANYTYSKSNIKVAEGDTTIQVASAGVPTPATDVFSDGQPLTGQSEHIANLQFGLQNQGRLSEQTVLVTYASERVTNRGPGGQPDLIEKPDVRFDFVARQGIELGGIELELKFEARNITNVRYQEFQRLGGSRIDNNSYDLGRTFSLGIGATF